MEIRVHRLSNEVAWWKDAGIDPVKVARRLWKLTPMVGTQSSLPLRAPAIFPPHQAAVDAPQPEKG